LAEMTTPEAVAFALLEKIAGTERWADASASQGKWHATGVNRTKILDTYAECLDAVRGKRAKGMSMFDQSLRPGPAG